MNIDEEHKKALDVIIMHDNFLYRISYEEVFEFMIEDYLTREGGRLGYFENGIYKER